MADPTKTPTSGRRGRLIALCGVGAFIIVAGTMLPKLIVPAAPTAAETAPATPTPGELIPAEWRPYVDRALVAVAIAVLLGVIVAWLLRRQKSAQAPAAPRLLNVIAALPLPHQCCAYLIRVGERQFLAGVDAGGIRSVVPLPSPPVDDDAESTSQAAPGMMRVIA